MIINGKREKIYKYASSCNKLRDQRGYGNVMGGVRVGKYDWHCSHSRWASIYTARPAGRRRLSPISQVVYLSYECAMY
jgi:hypothetical protein